MLDEIFELVDAQVFAVQRAEESQVGQVAARHRRGRKRFGPAEVVALEQSISVGSRFFDDFSRFDFFRDHPDTSRDQPSRQLLAFARGNRQHVDLHEAGERNERFGWRAGHEIVERQREAARVQTPARLDELVVDLDVFEQLDHHRRRREQRARTVQQQTAGEIDEGEASVREHVEAEREHGVGQHARAGDVAVRRTRRRVRAASVQQLVAVHTSSQIKDRLTCDAHRISGIELDRHSAVLTFRVRGARFSSDGIGRRIKTLNWVIG